MSNTLDQNDVNAIFEVFNERNQHGHIVFHPAIGYVSKNDTFLTSKTGTEITLANDFEINKKKIGRFP